MKWDFDHFLKPTEGRKPSLKKPDSVPKRQFHEAGNFKALWGLLFITTPLGLFLSRKNKNLRRPVISVFTHSHAPESIIEHTQSCEQQTRRRGASYLTSSPSSSIDRQMVHFSSVSSSAPSSSSCLPCSFLCLWERFGQMTFDTQHRVLFCCLSRLIIYFNNPIQVVSVKHVKLFS